MDLLVEKVLRKARDSQSVKEAFFQEHAGHIAACSREMAERFALGAQLFVMGNGGSACDAQHVSVEFMHPVIEKRQPLRAMALTNDTALLTALGNDRDYSEVFAQQLRTLARPGDIALAITTSGQSSSIVRGLKMAREKNLMTIGFTGGDGGKLPPLCDHLFVVPSFSIHRIQETHVALMHIVWDLIHITRGEEDTI